MADESAAPRYEDDDPPMAPHRKEGRGCFLVLILVSAIPVVFFLITFAGGDFLTYFYMRNWVTDHALMRRMPVVWNKDERAEARRLLDKFYDAGRAGKIPSTYVISVSSEYKEMMSYPGGVHQEALRALLRHAWSDMVKFKVVKPGPMPLVMGRPENQDKGSGE
ncbi:MAG: hypothetical protein ACYC9S_07775 [Leptospirales bacterium]